MRKLYDMINKILNDIDFEKIWSGFRKNDFALYNKDNVYLHNKVIPYDNRFLGNTSISYENKELAIWFVENVEYINYKELASNIVHEMFHSYQKYKKETRFPNDIKALSYPNNLENFQLKYNENLLLIEAFNTKKSNKKFEILKQIIASRRLRIKKFGEVINCEFGFETIEGCAEYCGTKALKIISDDLYKKRIDEYKRILKDDMDTLFNIRRCCYFTGTLLLILLDDLNIKFSKEITNEKFTIFEQVEENIETNDIVLKQQKNPVIENELKKDIIKKENLFNDFFGKDLVKHKGEFYICGYDPMNMIKIDNKILCSSFIILGEKNTNNTCFIPGPTVVEFEKGEYIISTYYTLLS